MSNIITDEEFLKDILGESRVTPTVQQPLSQEEQFALDTGFGEGSKDSDDNSETNDQGLNDNSQGDSDNGDNPIPDPQPDVVTNKRFGVKDTITSLIENNIWHDGPVTYGDKEYGSITELIESEKPTKELFDSIALAQKKLHDDDINSSYLKIEDPESVRTNLASAILAGVDYSDLVSTYQEVIEPLSRIDFANSPDGEWQAEQFVKQCMVEIDGYHPASVDIAIDKLKKEFQLINVAEQYQELNIQRFNEDVINRKKEYEAKIAEETKAIQEDIKSFRNTLKSEGISDTFSKQMIDLRYAVDPDTGRYHFEELIFDRMEDKGFQARLMHFLLNEEDFINKQKSKVKTETQKRVLEIARIAPGAKGGRNSEVKDLKPTNMTEMDKKFLIDLGFS